MNNLSPAPGPGPAQTCSEACAKASLPRRSGDERIISVTVGMRQYTSASSSKTSVGGRTGIIGKGASASATPYRQQLNLTHSAQLQRGHWSTQQQPGACTSTRTRAAFMSTSIDPIAGNVGIQGIQRTTWTGVLACWVGGG
jgi:hypothetical protein